MSIIFILCNLLILAIATEPGIRVRVTKNGLDYADNIGAILLNTLIRTSAIPDQTIDISGGPGSGKATARNIRMIKFRPLNYAYNLHAPNALEWSTIGGSISISGDWVAWYKILFTFWFHGGFTASVNDIRLSATGSAIKDTDGKPAVKLLACKAKIGSVSVQITGGFIPSIIDLFSSDIASSIKSALESQVCQQASTVFITVLNEKLKSLPTKIHLGDGFYLDYSLNSSPEIGDTYVQSSLNGSITWRDGSSAPIDCPPLPSVTGQLNRMVYIWGSDYVLNTFLHSAHVHNASKVLVDRYSFPEIAPYLRTKCPGEMCVGNISHVIPDRYPNGYAQIELQTSSAPTSVVKSTGARLSATIRANMYAEPKSDQNLLVIFDILFSGELTVKVVNSQHDTKLAGDLLIDQFNVQVNRSFIGYISPWELRIAVILAKPFLQKLANDYLNAGVIVPTIPDVELKNAQVTLMERSVQVDADVKYKNYTFISL